jgi:hypothetical protein
MTFMVRAVLVIFAAFSAGVLFPGCGPSKKALDEYDAKLSALESKGVPDSLLSSIRVYLSQAKAGKESNNGILAASSMDSVKAYVAAAEKWYADETGKAKPHVDQLMTTLGEKKKSLSGLQLREADSVMQILDELVKKGWYPQALGAVDQFDALMTSLLKDEAQARKVSANIVGTWTKSKKHTQDGANAVEKTKVSFNKDGTFSMDEQMKGQTKPTLKEDWQFQSSGTYGIKGDTILLSVQKEKRLREMYWNLKGKNQWVKNEKKPYDTAITNGSKDRFFTYEYLKEDFKK